VGQAKARGTLEQRIEQYYAASRERLENEARGKEERRIAEAERIAVPPPEDQEIIRLRAETHNMRRAMLMGTVIGLSYPPGRRNE
jgi:predicted O-methyltransferase YrrM